MFYAAYEGRKEVVTNYIDSEGNQIEIGTGTYADFYGIPVEFKANISSSLNEVHAREYGVDQSSIYSEICCPKGYLPLDIGTLVWKNTEITYNDDGTPDKTTADYTVMGILDEYLDYDWYLLKRTNKSTEVI